MLDHVVIIVYLVATLGIGFLAGKKTTTFRDFAIGKRNISSFALLAAIMASIIDASETLDYANEVLNEGLIYCFAYLGTALASLLLAFFFAPRFGRFLGQAHSTGDVIEAHFGIRAKTLIGIATLVETILFCGTQILAISITIQYFFGISGNIASVIISIITLLYFFRGGARSVNATDIFQFAILLVVLPIFCGIALSKVGNYSAIFSLIEANGLNFTSAQPASSGKCLAMLILFTLPGQYPLTIQRMLMAKDIEQLKKVFISDALLGTALRIMVLTLGVAAFLLLPSSDSNLTLLELANHLLPAGAKGLAVVGLLAVMMSTIDSTIHLGAVALTQDIFGSLSKTILADADKLRHARYSSLFVIVGAILTSLNFEKIGDMFYLLMALGNCLIWPAVFLGLTGISSSARGFWLGATVGLSTQFLCMFIFDADLLYLNLIATAANLCTHAIYVVYIEKHRFHLAAVKHSLRSNILRTKILKQFPVIRIVRNKDYCSIFAALSIFLCVYPFFMADNKFDFREASSLFLALSMTIGFLAVSILFAEVWDRRLLRFYPVIWGSLIVLSLPAQTYLMLISSGYDFIWILDAILIIPLMLTLSTKFTSFLLHIVGVTISVAIAYTGLFSYALMPADFAHWAVLMHAIVLTLCLALFRKRDVDFCRFEVSTIAHETRRILNTLEGVAHFSDHRLPLLISSHNSGSQSPMKQLRPDEMELLLSLPSQIQHLTERVRKLLNTSIARLSSFSTDRIFTKSCSIKRCIIEAAADSSLSQNTKDALKLDLASDISIKGDQDQLIQMFINILENAGHAIASKDAPSISINIEGNTVFISDNGCGIDPVHLPNIFEKSFSTKSSHGQGLAFCRSTMHEHGGSILCTSEQNSFTRFELRFPR